MGRKQTCQPAQLLVQATNRHSDLMLKSGPLLGPLLRFTLRITPYKAKIICEVQRPLLGTTNCSISRYNLANVDVVVCIGPLCRVWAVVCQSWTVGLGCTWSG